MGQSKTHIVLSTKDLVIGYRSGKHQIVVAGPITMSMNKGDLIGVVGANGIGKSTLLRTITGVQPALNGSVTINQKKLEDHSRMEMARNLSVVLTDSIASKNLTAYELIALSRHPYTNWIGAMNTEDMNHIEKAIESTNCSDYIHKKCYELSDGQLQKVMIARAMAQDTDIIVLDEPTTHLDMYHKAHILILLKELAQKTKKTIIFSSHEIDLAIQLSDKLLVMSKNKSELASPKAHIEAGNFEALFPKDLISFDPVTKAFRVNK